MVKKYTVEMTGTELASLKTLAKYASDDMSNKGCNDFTLNNTQEAWDLYVKMFDHMSGETPDERPAGKLIYFQDWMLLRYLSEKVLPEVK